MDALILAKSIRESCLNGEKGADLSSVVGGESGRPEGTEITGETKIKGLKKR